jgi:uncharacterized membrane protein
VSCACRGRHGPDRIVAEITTAYVISVFHKKSYEFEFRKNVFFLSDNERKNVANIVLPMLKCHKNLPSIIFILICLWGLRFIVLSATFNNISVLSWRSVLLVGETGENHDLPQVDISLSFILNWLYNVLFCWKFFFLIFSTVVMTH